MKIKLFVFAALISFLNLKGQNEFRISLNSGLFSYSGKAANGTSEIFIYDNETSGFTLDPYGSNGALCYGLSLNFKSITKKNLVLGFDTGYEILRSSVSINKLLNVRVSITPGGFPSPSMDALAVGETIVTNSVINLNPFIGKRFKSKNISVDVVGGFDVCYILKSREKGEAHVNGNSPYKYETSRNIKTINFDFRPRIQISLDVNKIGFYLGYSHGIVSHVAENDNINSDVRSRFIRFGLTGKIF
ncbi:hypothetical protein [Flavobacterium sp.]|uniref:hypothetical protein n=1 Tax=Flavobacterium sp. TaxID=239 RepID=UPI003528C44F